MQKELTTDALISLAKEKLDLKEAPGATKAGWLMITALLIESWDIYSMAFIIYALKDVYHPNSWLLGFTAAGTQMGAIIGAMVGGWLTDKLGRRKIFLYSMLLFAIFALLQGLAPNIYWLAIIRCFAGVPVGGGCGQWFYLSDGGNAERSAGSDGEPLAIHVCPGDYHRYSVVHDFDGAGRA